MNTEPRPPAEPAARSGDDSSGCCGPTRREALKWMGLGATALATARLPAFAGPFTPSDFERLVPADKKLSVDWVRSLFAQGESRVFRGSELELIGMPGGGLTAGPFYLGGDGRLWPWDIFNHLLRTGAGHYERPLKPASPMAQGFMLRVGDRALPLDRTGFTDVSFRGEYPIGMVEYRDASARAAVTLEAFSPFIPLNVDDSNLPATYRQKGSNQNV